MHYVVSTPILILANFACKSQIYFVFQTFKNLNLISEIELVHFSEESATMNFQTKEGLIRYLKGKTEKKMWSEPNIFFSIHRMKG